MGLETATYISGLNSANPVGASDPKSQGDDHIRLIKSTLLATFPNITGAVTLTHTQINDAMQLSADNTISGSNTIQNAAPKITFDETGVAADSGAWQIRADATEFHLYTLNDLGSAVGDPIKITRSTTTPTEIELNATTIDINGAADITSVNVSGASLRVGGSSPYLRYTNAGATANNGVWDLTPIGDILYGRVLDDAESASSNWLRVLRTTTTVDEIELNATLLDVNATTIELSGTVYSNSNMQIQSSEPWLYFRETDGAADEEFWRLGESGGALYLQTRTDAGGAGETAIFMNRTGTAVTEIELNADAIDLNGGTSGIDIDVGAAGRIEFIGASNIWMRDGATFRIYDSADTDSLQIAHNGTDAVMTGNNTSALRTSGMAVVAGRTYRSTSTTPTMGQVHAVSAGLTVPDGQTAGDWFAVYNNSASAITLTQDTSLTLRLAGTSSSGNRTLAARGLAVIWYNGTNEAICAGDGVT